MKLLIKCKLHGLVVRVLVLSATMSLAGSRVSANSQSDWAKQWTNQQAAVYALDGMANHLSRIRGSSASQSFLAYHLKFRGREGFGKTLEWSWNSGEDIFVWNHQCYLSAEAGIVCYQSSTDGNAIINSSHSRAKGPPAIQIMAIKVSEVLAAPNLNPSELWVVADRDAWFLILSLEASRRTYYRCPYSAASSCQSVDVRSVPELPNYR